MRVSRAQIEEYLASNADKVSLYARRYAGRGAEAEDLEQEGYLTIISFLRQYSKRNISRMTEQSLKGITRDAAAKQRRRDDTVRLSQCDDDDSDEYLLKEEHIADPAAENDFRLIELNDMLERALNPDDLSVATMLMNGWTQADTARRLGVSQQSVSKRLARIRTALEEYVLR
jgi:RNA polymerase sigma factor (sigma-70 family)